MKTQLLLMLLVASCKPMAPTGPVVTTTSGQVDLPEGGEAQAPKIEGEEDHVFHLYVEDSLLEEDDGQLGLTGGGIVANAVAQVGEVKAVGNTTSKVKTNPINPALKNKRVQALSSKAEIPIHKEGGEWAAVVAKVKAPTQLQHKQVEKIKKLYKVHKEGGEYADLAKRVVALNRAQQENLAEISGMPVTGLRVLPSSEKSLNKGPFATMTKITEDGTVKANGSDGKPLSEKNEASLNAILKSIDE